MMLAEIRQNVTRGSLWSHLGRLFLLEAEERAQEHQRDFNEHQHGQQQHQDAGRYRTRGTDNPLRERLKEEDRTGQGREGQCRAGRHL